MELIKFPFCNRNYPAQPFLLNGYGMLVKKLTPKKGLYGIKMIQKINYF